MNIVIIAMGAIVNDAIHVQVEIICKQKANGNTIPFSCYTFYKTHRIPGYGFLESVVSKEDSAH